MKVLSNNAYQAIQLKQSMTNYAHTCKAHMQMYIHIITHTHKQTHNQTHWRTHKHTLAPTHKSIPQDRTHHDSIWVNDRVESVSNGEHSASSELLTNCSLDQRICPVIKNSISNLNTVSQQRQVTSRRLWIATLYKTSPTRYYYFYNCHYCPKHRLTFHWKYYEKQMAFSHGTAS